MTPVVSAAVQQGFAIATATFFMIGIAGGMLCAMERWGNDNDSRVPKAFIIATTVACIFSMLCGVMNAIMTMR
jgi:hypothetical protein